MEAGPAPAPRRPSREALLASLPPGLGHLREGQWSRGLSLLAGFLFVLYVVATPAHYAIPPPPWGLAAAGLAVSLGFWLYAAHDLERLRSPAARTGRPSSPPGARSR